MIDDQTAERLFTSSPQQTEEAKAAAPTAEDARAFRMFKSSMPQPASEAAATLATSEAAGTKPLPTAGAIKAAPKAVADSNRDYAADIKASTPREIAELRASSEDARAEKLYGETPHDAIVAAMANDSEAPEGLRGPAAVEWSKVARDIGIDDAETRYVTQRIGQLRLERATGEAPVTREAALKSTMDALSRQFDDPVQAFNDAAKLARRDPRVARLLDMTGLGNDPGTIALLARRAMSERGKGRLK